MHKSESIGKLAEALSKVQGQIKGAAKDGTNPHFRASYATLSSIWEACREELAANNLAVVQTMEADESHAVIVETTLIHSSGEWISGRLGMNPTKTDPQGIGSAITYARRYALAAIVGVAPEDDDAEGATSRAQPRQAQSRPQAVPSLPETDEELDAAIRAELKRINKTNDSFQAWFEKTYETDSKWSDMSIKVKQDVLMTARTWKKKTA